MNKKTTRINKLIDILKICGFVSIKELSSMLNVSEMTIRRDLEILKNNDIAENIYGTTVYNPAHTVVKNEDEYNLLGEVKKKNAQKDDIGRFAASLVDEDDIIIIDTGSTTERIAANLPTDKSLSVLCYGVNILMELRRNPGVKMLFAGGFYHANTQMFESPESIDFIKGVRAQKVFISAAGVHRQLGVTCVNSYEVPVKRAILQSSVQKILVTDSSKFDVVRPAFFCELDRIDIIVTDNALGDEWRRLIAEAGIKLYTV
ncbi:MAG: DeoR/GlpR family DNA-binding transcription regulator [Hydrogenoanaerobacterium sp.]